MRRSALGLLLIALGLWMHLGPGRSHTGAAESPTAPPTLPSGPGLAARYQRDVGLARDASVVFADDVESAVDADCRHNDRWATAWGQCRITRDAPNLHEGRQALELTLTGPGTVGVRKPFDEGFDRLFLRYYIRYDEAFLGSHHAGASMQARAPGVPFVNPGVVPSGTDQFGVILDHWTRDPTVRSPGHLVAYVYHMDQRHRWGEQFYPSGRTRPEANGKRGIFGPSFVSRRDFLPALGRWYSYELMVQANEPGRSDGRVAFWIDGRLAADFPNLRFRSVASLKLNWIAIGLYESSRPGLRRIWVDDIVLATEYIGPMASGS